jgi:Domain of unknown function (DUF1707)
MPEPHLRAGDDDREVVAAALGKHMAAGRLTLAEYEDRLSRAYAARTFGELAELTADLPPLTGASAPRAAAATAAPESCSVPVSCLPRGMGVPAPMAPWVRHEHPEKSWRAWATTSVIVLVVYLALSLGDGDLDHFWPMWVIGPWGAALLAHRFGGSRERPRDESPQLGR